MVSDLGNVDQAVHTVHDLSECTEGHQADDLDGSNVTDCILVSEDVPGVGGIGLVAKGDALLLGVVALDVHGDLLTNGNDLSGALDALPGQLGAVDHTVHAAEVNECTVAGHALDHAGVDLALLDLLPEGLLLCTALVAQDETNGALGTLLVSDLQDAQGHGLTDKSRQIAVARNAGMCGGNEDAVVQDNGLKAALVDADDLALEVLLSLVCGLDQLPVLVRVNALLGELSEAVAVADTNHECLHLISDFEHLVQFCGRIVRDLLKLDNTGHLGAQIQLDLSSADAGNNTGHSISCI